MNYGQKIQENISKRFKTFSCIFKNSSVIKFPLQLFRRSPGFNFFINNNCKIRILKIYFEYLQLLI